jgi:hypothetical protein
VREDDESSIMCDKLQFLNVELPEMEKKEEGGEIGERERGKEKIRESNELIDDKEIRGEEGVTEGEGKETVGLFPFPFTPTLPNSNFSFISTEESTNRFFSFSSSFIK